jgi:hypothetical protein
VLAVSCYSWIVHLSAGNFYELLLETARAPSKMNLYSVVVVARGL